MAWDSSRPVPVRRLVREWLIYAGIASVGFVIYYKVEGKPIKPSLFFGLASSGPMYILFGVVMAKFGYQRKTMKEIRANRPAPGTPRVPRASSRSGSAAVVQAPGPRPKPPPTRRTSTGPSQHRKSTKPKRR